MPRWLDRLRGLAALEPAPEIAGMAPPVFELPPEMPPGVDGALWASWAARWQEF